MAIRESEMSVLARSFAIWFCLIAAMALPTLGAAQDVARPNTLKLEGSAMNVSIGITAGVKIEIGTFSEEVLTANGAFDGTNLVGRFQTVGRALDCSDGNWCFQFQGALLGLEEGGFPKGTSATFTLTLTVPKDGSAATGVYTLGPVPGVDFAQVGTVSVTPAGR